MKEFLIVVFVAFFPIVIMTIFDLKVTVLSAIWHIFALVSILMWQHESYKNN
jgi:D-alanyl-lipoteichoic acid acyltransferase DltB (MBOAT superfamily)